MTQTLLLDASVWLAARDRDDIFHDAARLLVGRAATDEVAVAALDLTLYEVANVAVVRWRSRTDALELAELVRLACPDTLERVDAGLLADAADAAAEHRLTVYAGAYVAAARRRGWTLVSGDLDDLVRPGLATSPDAVVS